MGMRAISVRITSQNSVTNKCPISRSKRCRHFSTKRGSKARAVQTLKNLKWGLSAIFEAAIKNGYITFNPARGTDLPPEEIKEQKQLPTGDQLNRLIERLPEPASTAAWLVVVSSIRPEELAFKWRDLDAGRRMLWVVRAVNRGKLHTPKYHRTNRPIRLRRTLSVCSP